MRNYEPKLALVPASPPQNSKTDREAGGDIFYPHLLHIAHELNIPVIVFEVADMAQARRVVRMVIDKGVWEGLEVWRDFPGQAGRDGEEGEVVDVDGREVRVKGEGEGRAVCAWRGGWGGLFGEEGGEWGEG